jgi:formylmethanofuran dehydrogenase subunit E
MSVVRLKIIPLSGFIPKSNDSVTTTPILSKPQGRFLYTLGTFLERAHIVHGDKFDYSNITHKHVDKGRESRVPLTCFTCQHSWDTTIHSHITGRTGCPNCAGNLRWTYEKFIVRSKEVHGNKYNYTNVTPEDIINKTHPIKIICNTCTHEFMMNIHHHITYKQGCPKCAGRLRWGFDRFITAALHVHGDKYDYSEIDPKDIENNRSRITLGCNQCKQKWETYVYNHINTKYCCPHCADNRPWTFDEFLEEANILHDKKYIYERPITDKVNAYTRFLVRCTICNHNWETTINARINCKTGCANCAGLAPMELRHVHKRRHEITW